MQRCLGAEAAAPAVHTLLVVAVPEGQHMQLLAALLELPVGLLPAAAHMPQEGRNLVEACCNLQVGTGRNLLAAHTLLAAVSSQQEDHSRLVGGRNLLARWSGVRRSLGGCHRLLLGDRILLGGLDLAGGIGVPLGHQAWLQGHMGIPRGHLEIGLGVHHMVLGHLEPRGRVVLPLEEG